MLASARSNKYRRAEMLLPNLWRASLAGRSSLAFARRCFLRRTLPRNPIRARECDRSTYREFGFRTTNQSGRSEGH